MHIEKIEIDISSDIAKKLIDFLEKLPKEKVKIKYKNSNDKKVLYETAGILKEKNINPITWQNSIRNEWENK